MNEIQSIFFGLITNQGSIIQFIDYFQWKYERNLLSNIISCFTQSIFEFNFITHSILIIVIVPLNQKQVLIISFIVCVWCSECELKSCNRGQLPVTFDDLWTIYYKVCLLQKRFKAKDGCGAKDFQWIIARKKTMRLSLQIWNNNQQMSMIKEIIIIYVQKNVTDQKIWRRNHEKLHSRWHIKQIFFLLQPIYFISNLPFLMSFHLPLLEQTLKIFTLVFKLLECSLIFLISIRDNLLTCFSSCFEAQIKDIDHNGQVDLHLLLLFFC